MKANGRKLLAMGLLLAGLQGCGPWNFKWDREGGLTVQPVPRPEPPATGSCQGLRKEWSTKLEKETSPARRARIVELLEALDATCEKPDDALWAKVHRLIGALEPAAGTK